MLDSQDQEFIKELLVKTESDITNATKELLVKTESDITNATVDMVEQNVLPVLEKLDERLIRVEAEMVTKAYLDDKLADFRGDLVVLTRKEDTKLRELVTVLHEKNILTDPDIKRILSMEPFPQLML